MNELLTLVNRLKILLTIGNPQFLIAHYNRPAQLIPKKGRRHFSVSDINNKAGIMAACIADVAVDSITKYKILWRII